MTLWNACLECCYCTSSVTSSIKSASAPSPFLQPLVDTGTSIEPSHSKNPRNSRLEIKDMRRLCPERFTRNEPLESGPFISVGRLSARTPFVVCDICALTMRHYCNNFSNLKVGLAYCSWLNMRAHYSHPDV